jgi:hypothetical protein
VLPEGFNEVTQAVGSAEGFYHSLPISQTTYRHPLWWLDHVTIEDRPLIGLLFLTQAMAEGGGLFSALQSYECCQDES